MPVAEHYPDDVPPFFHVSRSPALAAGHRFEITPIAEFDPIPDAALQAHVADMFPDGLTQHGREYFFWQNGWAFPPNPAPVSAKDLDTMRSRTMELLWEYVRRAHFPERPSRFQSVFAWRSLDDAHAFVVQLGLVGATIWKVEGDEVFRADMELLRYLATVQGSLFAHRYWRGEANPDMPPRWESFLAPPVTLVAPVQPQADIAA